MPSYKPISRVIFTVIYFIHMGLNVVNFDQLWIQSISNDKLASADSFFDLLVVFRVHDDMFIVALLWLEVVLLISHVMDSHHGVLLLPNFVISFQQSFLEGDYSIANRSVFLD